MKCPLCNEEVIRERNLKKHQKGKVCKGWVFDKTMRADGWLPVHNRYRDWLKAAGVAFVMGPVMYEGFGNARYVKVRNFAWVPKEVAEVLHRREGVMTFVGRIYTPCCDISAVKELLHEYGQRQRPKPGNAKKVR